MEWEINAKSQIHCFKNKLVYYICLQQHLCQIPGLYENTVAVLGYCS